MRQDAYLSTLRPKKIFLSNEIKWKIKAANNRTPQKYYSYTTNTY